MHIEYTDGSGVRLSPTVSPPMFPAVICRLRLPLRKAPKGNTISRNTGSRKTEEITLLPSGRSFPPILLKMRWIRRKTFCPRCTKAIENNDSVNTDAALSKLLKTVCSTNQSNPKACIDAHPVEYQRMTYFGNYLLCWSFARFSNGGQTGLEGSIMASACREIIGSAEAGSPEATGQAWYDTFIKNVETLRRNNGDDYMKKNRPSSWHVLQLLGEAPK